MGVFVKVVLAVIAMVLLLATTTEARELLDYYDQCYNGYRGWKNGGCRGDYFCNNYRWGCDGRYYNGARWFDPYDRSGFCVGVCVGK
ncbi:g7751 [Coccomyxa elongata]